MLTRRARNVKDACAKLAHNLTHSFSLPGYTPWHSERARSKGRQNTELGRDRAPALSYLNAAPSRHYLIESW
jgi:hypothetical protein